MSPHQCEFCHDEFVPRPQVKHPRACQKCQQHRQKKNEEEWRKKNKDLYSSIDHRTYREQRGRRISGLVMFVLRSMKIGFSFLGLTELQTTHKDLEKDLVRFFDRIGLRQINKFWPDLLLQDFTTLPKGLHPGGLQTS